MPEDATAPSPPARGQPETAAFVFPEPPPVVGRVATLLRAFGPGAIIASVSIASGETIFAARGGAIFGYRLLWLVLLAGVLKGLMIYSAAHYAVVAGQNPLVRWCEIPGPRAWPAWFILLTCFLLGPFALAGLSKMLSSFLFWTFAGAGQADAHPQAVARLGVAVLLAFAGVAIVSHYRFLEIAEKMLVGLLMVFVLIALFAASPDWLAALRHLLLPLPPRYDAWVKELYPAIAAKRPILEVATYFGVVGGTLPDYVAYLAFLREKGWGRLAAAPPVNGGPGRHAAVEPADAARARAWLRLPRLDVIASFACVTVFTLSFMILGAAILNPERAVPDGFALLEKQSVFLTRLHPALLYVYQLGIFAAFGGTLYAAYEVQVRSVHESLCAIAPRRRWRLGRVRLWFYLWAIAATAPIILTGLDPVRIYTPWSLLAGTLALGLWCLAMAWTDRRFLPPPLALVPAVWIGTLIAGIVMTALGIVSITGYFASL